MEIFARAVEESKNPLCYNGNLFTVTDIEEIIKQYPTVSRLMVGRGLIGNPGLVHAHKLGQVMEKEDFHRFHDRLVQAYGSVLCGEKDVLFRKIGRAHV